jgi:hypothetical protein
MGTPLRLASSCLFTTTTTGTGTYSVGAAVTGYFAPADISPTLNGARVSYVVTDSLTAPTIREEGEGVLTSGSPWTLTRATIRRSLSGGVAGSSAINWSAGTKYIWLSPLGPTLPSFDTDGWARLGWQQQGDTVVLGSALASWTFNIPSWASEYLIEWSDVQPVGGAGELAGYVSTNNAVSYLTGGSDYDGPFDDARSGGSTYGTANTLGRMPLSPSLSTVAACIGSLRMRLAAGSSCLVEAFGLDATPARFRRKAGYASAAGVAPTNILIGFTASRNIAAGARFTAFARG